jgi:hypothetical protein
LEGKLAGAETALIDWCSSLPKSDVDLARSSPLAHRAISVAAQLLNSAIFGSPKVNELDKISMVCANFGNGMNIAGILEDWSAFLGGKPSEVLMVDGGSDQATNDHYWSLFSKGMIDKLQILRKDHPDNHKDKCFIQEYYAGALASMPYLLFFKIDTVPYRNGHDGWLTAAMQHLERPDCFAVGGSFNFDSRHHAAWPGWYFSHKCSLNFALMKREKFMAAMHEFAGDFILSGFRKGHPLAGKPDERFLIERAFEAYMERHQQYTLAREEDETWSVAHTNLRDEALSRARESFLSRRNVATYIERQNQAREPNGVYYGMRGPSASKRLRIAIGRSVLGQPWRILKQFVRSRAIKA